MQEIRAIVSCLSPCCSSCWSRSDVFKKLRSLFLATALWLSKLPSQTSKKKRVVRVKSYELLFSDCSHQMLNLRVQPRNPLGEKV